MSTNIEGDSIPPSGSGGSGGMGIGRWVRAMSARERWGWIATILGFVVILAGVLHLTSATVGGRVHEFKERRTYNEVKLAAHRAFPVTVLLGFAGMGLVFLGGKLRASGRKAERPG